MTARHKNIPFFIPHQGCGNSCIFCSQVKITGVCATAKEISDECTRLLETVSASLDTLKDGDTAEIAFFGGSFTGIERERMLALLETANSCIGGKIKGIRLSTRPDYIDREICGILKKYGVTAVELGIQSASDEVLLKNKRGHTKAQSETACRLIKEYGFSLTGQMMCGLFGSSADDEIDTANKIVKWGCDSARIYPTVVFEDTKLYDLTLCGSYIPLTLEDAVDRASECAWIFIKNNVKLLRIGLHSSENLKSAPFGATHPALGELVIGRIYYKLMLPLLKNYKGQSATVFVPKGATSKALGQKRQNILKLQDETKKSITIREDESLAEYTIKIKE